MIPDRARYARVMAISGRPPVRAIFFDAGNTLLRMNYAVIAARLVELGYTVSPEDVQQAEWRARVRLDAARFAPAGARASTESGSARGDYVRYLLEGLAIEAAAVVEAMVEWRSHYNVPVGLWNTADPEAATALTLAREAGMGAAVISNSNGSVRSILDGLGLTRHLDFVIDSFEVGVEKPDARIFRLGLDRAGLAPHEVVYVGDLYSVDVLGARAVGMDAVLLDPGGCWGRSDCLAAPGPLAAVRLILSGRRPAHRP